MNQHTNSQKIRQPDRRPLSRQRRSNGVRSGAAVVEAALLTPLLVIVTLGAIDIGQYINVTQTLSNASRIGTRLACRDDSIEVSVAENEMREYVAAAFPQFTPGDLDSAIDVSVHAADGTRILKDLSTVPSGEQLFVRVTLDFAAVRWIGGVNPWSMELPTMECYGRRE